MSGYVTLDTPFGRFSRLADGGSWWDATRGGWASPMLSAALDEIHRLRTEANADRGAR